MGVIANSFVCCCPDQTRHHIVKLEDIEDDDTNKYNKKFSKATTLDEIGIKASTSVIKREANPESLYEMIEELGEGAFGRVVKVKHLKTGEIRAMKIVDKGLLNDGFDEEEIANEINILKSLDHPNIIKVYEYFDYKTNLFIVNELIPNGDLFKLIEQKTLLCEPLALRILQQMLSAVHFLHSENVIHGDIKPENIMIDNYNNCSFGNKKNPTYEDLFGFEIKLIDFGTSRIFSKSKVFDKLVGTAYYVAPEVILGGYHKQCDLWSCGVVFYVMLSGRLPFMSEDEEELYEMIKNSKPSFNLKEFKDTTELSLDLLKKLLEKDPIERITAKNALSHGAFNILGSIRNKKNGETVNKTFSKNALKRLGTVKKNQKFQQAITTFITHNFLSKDIATKHKEIFKALDIDGDGRVTNDELVEGYKKAGLSYSDEEVQMIIKSVDKDNNGFIEMEEFISASVDLDVLLSETNMRLAFETIDLDNSGAVSFEEVGKFVGGGEIDEELMKQIVADVGKSPEDEFTFEDFKSIMQMLKFQGSIGD
jgi:calcium-dependent protein kinase